MDHTNSHSRDAGEPSKVRNNTAQYRIDRSHRSAGSGTDIPVLFRLKNVQSLEKAAAANTATVPSTTASEASSQAALPTAGYSTVATPKNSSLPATNPAQYATSPVLSVSTASSTSTGLPVTADAKVRKSAEGFRISQNLILLGLGLLAAYVLYRIGPPDSRTAKAPSEKNPSSSLANATSVTQSTKDVEPNANLLDSEITDSASAIRENQALGAAPLASGSTIPMIAAPQLPELAPLETPELAIRSENDEESSGHDLDFEGALLEDDAERFTAAKLGTEGQEKMLLGATAAGTERTSPSMPATTEVKSQSTLSIGSSQNSQGLELSSNGAKSAPSSKGSTTLLTSGAPNLDTETLLSIHNQYQARLKSESGQAMALERGLQGYMTSYGGNTYAEQNPNMSAAPARQTFVPANGSSQGYVPVGGSNVATHSYSAQPTYSAPPPAGSNVAVSNAPTTTARAYVPISNQWQNAPAESWDTEVPTTNTSMMQNGNGASTSPNRYVPVTGGYEDGTQNTVYPNNQAVPNYYQTPRP